MTPREQAKHMVKRYWERCRNGKPKLRPESLVAMVAGVLVRASQEASAKERARCQKICLRCTVSSEEEFAIAILIHNAIDPDNTYEPKNPAD